MFLCSKSEASAPIFCKVVSVVNLLQRPANSQGAPPQRAQKGPSEDDDEGEEGTQRPRPELDEPKLELELEEPKSPSLDQDQEIDTTDPFLTLGQEEEERVSGKKRQSKKPKSKCK